MNGAVSEELIARQPPEAQQIIRALQEQIRSLHQQIEDLQHRLHLTPANSSKPPSSVHPHARPAPKKSRRKRRRGGQHGHQRHIRPLVPTQQCNHVHVLKPSRCRRCHQPLSGDDPDPLRHQVFELPEIKPLVTEYQQHRLRCPCCHITTCATLPQGVPACQAGPRLAAFTALLMGYFRQSKRRTALFLGSLLHVPASAAWVVKLQNLAAEALARPYQELAEALPEQASMGIDESPTKQGKARAWLWTFVTATFTLFTLRLNRKAAVPQELLGKDYGGAVMCDRAKMYFSVGKPQWCWAHLRRDFQSLIDHADRGVSRLGHKLMRQANQVFAWWGRYKAGEISHATLRRRMKPVQEAMKGLLLDGEFSGKAGVRGMCKELYAHQGWLWTYLSVTGVEPTNNGSERALRHAVIWRKLSFGTQSKRGSEFVERILTVIETRRQQGLSVFDYLQEAVAAHYHGKVAPSLLPVRTA